MTHDLRIIIGPATFRYVAWVCDCGHRSATYAEHERHLEEAS